MTEEQKTEKKRGVNLIRGGAIAGFIVMCMYAPTAALNYAMNGVTFSEDKENYTVTDSGFLKYVHYSHHKADSIFASSLSLKKFAESMIRMEDENNDGLVDQISNFEVNYNRGDAGTEGIFRQADKTWAEHVPRLERIAMEARTKLDSKRPEDHFKF